MSKNSTFGHIGVAFVTLTLLLNATLFTLPNKVQARKANRGASQSQKNENSIKKLGNRGLPVGRRRGGTSRNSCPTLNTPLTALVPGEETNKDLDGSISFLAKTISEYPTFWVYVPQLPSNLSSGEFILQNENGEDVYRTDVTLPSTSKVIGINLPSDSQYALKSGQKYHWYFKLDCSETTSEAEYFYVDAWIEKVALTPELKATLDSNKNTIQEYSIYRDRHHWYDKIATLAKLLQANPQDSRLKAEWNELINSVGLLDTFNISSIELEKIN